MAKLGEYGDKLESMTAQEVFNVSAEHLLTQGVKSITTPLSAWDSTTTPASAWDSPTCLYNGDGVCCAAAPFIRQYTPSIEGNNWITVVDRGKASANHGNLIFSLQFVHDDNSPTFWREELIKLARRGHLDHTVVDNFPEVSDET